MLEICRKTMKAIIKQVSLALLCPCLTSCFTLMLKDTWKELPAVETETLVSPLPARAARKNAQGVVFLRLSAGTAKGGERIVCLAEPIETYQANARADAGARNRAYAHARAELKEESDCPPIETASETLAPYDGKSKLLLPDIGIAVYVKEVRAPYYTGPLLADRLGKIVAVEQDEQGKIHLTDDGGRHVALAPENAGERAFFMSNATRPEKPETQKPLPFEAIPRRSAIVLDGDTTRSGTVGKNDGSATATESPRIVYFPENVADPSPALFILPNVQKRRFNPGNVLARGGLMLIFPVSIALDAVTFPLQIVAVVIVMNRCLNSIDNLVNTIGQFSRCLGVGR